MCSSDLEGQSQSSKPQQQLTLIISACSSVLLSELGVMQTLRKDSYSSIVMDSSRWSIDYMIGKSHKNRNRRVSVVGDGWRAPRGAILIANCTHT